jgi:hypothetical protein
MQITMDIPDYLADQVSARGLVLESYLREIMEEKLSQQPNQDAQRRLAVEAMRQFARKNDAKFGGDLKSSVHEGHKY